MAAVKTCWSPLASAVWLMLPEAFSSAFSPTSVSTVSLFTSTATVAPVLLVAGAADREPAMMRVVLPSLAFTSTSPLAAVTFTLLPMLAFTSLLVTTTAKEPAREDEAPPEMDPAIASA